jgi:hypothetical protein
MTRGFVRVGADIERSFRKDERQLLQDLCRGLLAILGADEDPVLKRLLPDAYPDDPAASVEYSGYTRARLARSKAEPAEAMLVDLGTSRDRVRLSPERVSLWLRGLTDLRLAITERIAASEREGIREPVLSDVADWLGWLLSDLLEVLDE